MGFQSQSLQIKVFTLFSLKASNVSVGMSVVTVTWSADIELT